MLFKGEKAQTNKKKTPKPLCFLLTKVPGASEMEAAQGCCVMGVQVWEPVSQGGETQFTENKPQNY